MVESSDAKFQKGEFRFPNSLEHAARTIDNEVVWVNPRLEHVIPLKKGDRDRSVSFLVSSGGPDADTTLEVRSGHYRTGMRPAKSVFELRDFPYRDQKGVGEYTRSWAGKSPMWSPQRSGIFGALHNKIYGLAMLDSLIYCAENTEKLIKVGVRPGCIISSISKLKEIPTWMSDGSIRMVPITDAKIPTWLSNKQFAGKFTKDRAPAIAQRHYSWPIRVADFHAHDVSAPERLQMINATLQHLSEKLGHTVSYKEYLEWFARDLGTSVARMHNAGLHHWWLHTQNVTADGGIMDNDSVGELSKLPWKRKEQLRRDDYAPGTNVSVGGREVVSSLAHEFNRIPEIHKVLGGKLHASIAIKIYTEAYKAELVRLKKIKT